jgi:hypothetical protein
MFAITSETLRQFSLSEVLLLIEMNIETIRSASQSHAGLATGEVWNHSRVTKAH